MSFYPLDPAILHKTVGFGVAGNFAGHLEQAGETPDFINVHTANQNEPKGLFPFYIPAHPRQLGTYPLSTTQIHYPQNLASEAHLQAEPEVCILFKAHYDNGMVTDLLPQAFAAFNDCSIRKPGAKKISEKKNWGPATKGIADSFIALKTFETGCDIDAFRIAAFLKRSGKIHAYGKDSSVLTYSYFHQQLQQWIIDKLNTQQNHGPLENLHQILQQAGYPEHLLISLGATCYTEYGIKEFLQPGDELWVYVYDASKNSEQDLYAHMQGDIPQLKNSSVLHQTIV